MNVQEQASDGAFERLERGVGILVRSKLPEHAHLQHEVIEHLLRVGMPQVEDAVTRIHLRIALTKRPRRGSGLKRRWRPLLLERLRPG
eukprot:1380227-Lingulodinium_polyedra.AAC.1